VVILSIAAVQASGTQGWGGSTPSPTDLGAWGAS